MTTRRKSRQVFSTDRQFTAKADWDGAWLTRVSDGMEIWLSIEEGTMVAKTMTLKTIANSASDFFSELS